MERECTWISADVIFCVWVFGVNIFFIFFFFWGGGVVKTKFSCEVLHRL